MAKVALVVHPQEDAHGHEAEESFVKTRRMAGQPLTWRAGCIPRVAGGVVVEGAAKLLRTAQKHETPRQGSRRAINLMVHHIADANQGSDEAHRNDDAVKNPDVVNTSKTRN